MITAIRRRMAARNSEAGVTLVELMVAMIVFGILSAIVVSLYTATNKSVLSTSTSDQNTQAAGNIMNEVSRVIRGGTTNPVSGGTTKPAFVTATANTLMMYSYVDSSALTPVPFLVKFTINSTTGQVLEQRWSASVDANGLFTFGTNPATPSTPLVLTRTLPGRLTPQTLFTYWDSAPTPTFLGASVSGATLADIGSVTVTVVVTTSTNPSVKPATLQNQVGIPNVTLENNS